MPTVFAPFAGNKLQFYREATPGTGAAATGLWRGKFVMIEDARARKTAEEQTGIIVQAERSFDTSYMAQLAMPSTELTFEQFPHICEAGILTATPSGSGPYARAYAYPLDGSVPAIKTYTWEGGNVVATADVREMNYGFVQSFEMSGQPDEAWTMAASWAGRQVSSAAFTAGLALIDVEEAIFARTKFYLENSGGNYPPTTQVSNALMGATIRVTTGWQIVPGGDGNLYFRGLKWTMPSITGSLTYELEQDGANSRVATERAAYENNSIRLIRFEILGSGDKAIDIYMPIKYDRFGAYENSNGNTTVGVDFHAVYSPDDAAFFNIDVVNNVATL